MVGSALLPPFDGVLRPLLLGVDIRLLLELRCGDQSALYCVFFENDNNALMTLFARSKLIPSLLKMYSTRTRASSWLSPSTSARISHLCSVPSLRFNRSFMIGASSAPK